ncbi:uncharacterized protein LOC129256250 [Lytechinus pictus]|uniref:uncharacterized protein LOC129256250 n=1 Tax=Lytechinus pictus TaxID=7653 RepID=UPI00240DDDAA|nr:uncharacterized protein LOC129256250 [Lytechinus pictus]
MDLTQSLFSVLIALCATFHLTHSSKSSFCKGRHPKLCHVHIGKRTFFSDDRDLSVPANIDPQSPAARLLAIDPSTIDLSGYLPEENAQLRQSPPEYLANQGEDVDIIVDSHPRKMRILRLIQEIMDSSLEEP